MPVFETKNACMCPSYTLIQSWGKTFQRRKFALAEALIAMRASLSLILIVAIVAAECASLKSAIHQRPKDQLKRGTSLSPLIAAPRVFQSDLRAYTIESFF